MQAELLTAPINFAVVQLPERKYPGVVVQGDTLYALQQQAEQIRRLLGVRDLEELADEIEDLDSRLSEVLAHYERVCSERGIALPYHRHDDHRRET